MTYATDTADIQNLISQAFNFRCATKVFGPALYQPAVMVAFGYRADAPAHPKTRRALDQMVTWA